MNSLTVIRDLVYQARYSEVIRISAISPDKYISKAYIKTHSNVSLPKRRKNGMHEPYHYYPWGVGQCGLSTGNGDGDGDDYGYSCGDGNGYGTLYGDGNGNAWAFNYLKSSVYYCPWRKLK